MASAAKLVVIPEASLQPSLAKPWEFWFQSMTCARRDASLRCFAALRDLSLLPSIFGASKRPALFATLRRLSHAELPREWSEPA